MDLRTLFINFHHLLNEYRPHQARESLILMMKDQLERSRKETEGILKMKEEVEGVLEGLQKIGLGEREVVNGEANGVVAGNRGIEGVEELNVWEALGREFG